MGLAGAAIVYALITALLFRNLLPDVATHLYSDLGDPLLNTAVLAWNARQVPLTEAWWNFPAFAPLPGVTAFTEHLLLTYPVASPLRCIWFIRPREWRRVVPVVAAAAVATMPLVPLLLGYRAWHATYGLARVYGEARTYAADIAGLASISHRESLWRGWLPATYGEGSLFPGVTIAALAVIAIAAATPVSRDRRSTWSRRLLAVGLLLIGLVRIRVWVGPEGWRVGQYRCRRSGRSGYSPSPHWRSSPPGSRASAFASRGRRAAWRRSMPPPQPCSGCLRSVPSRHGSGRVP
jgi:hypothetical protein